MLGNEMLGKGTPINDTTYQAYSLAEKLQVLDMGFTVTGCDIIRSDEVPTLFVQVKVLGERNLQVNYKEQGTWNISRFKNEESAVRFIFKWLNIPYASGQKKLTTIS